MNYETYVKIGLHFQETKRNAVVKYYNRLQDEFELKVSTNGDFILNNLNPEFVLEVLDYEAVEIVYRRNDFGEFLMLGGVEKLSNKPFVFPKGSKYVTKKEIE